MSTSGESVGGLYLSIQANVDSAKRSLERIQEEFEKTKEDAKNLRNTMHQLEGVFEATATAAFGLSAGLALLVMRYGKVETIMNRVQVASQATNQQMEIMTEQALELGAKFPVTMMDTANALYELTTAGLSAKQATEALGGVTRLAIASQLTMKESASAVVSVLNAWQLEASKATTIANQLAAASAASAAELMGLADSFRYASATAAQLGVTSSELSAFVGVLSDMGVRASIAGTAINNALLSLVERQDDAREALAKIGLSFDDFYNKAGQLKDIVEIATMFREAMQGMGQAKQMGILSEIFNIRGARAMAPLIENVKRYKEILAETAQAEVFEGIRGLGQIEQQELEARRQQIAVEGFTLQPGSIRDVLEQFQSLVEAGFGKKQLTRMLQVGLDITPKAAALLAGDLVRGTPLDSLVTGIKSATTAAELAEATMVTLEGQVRRLIGALDTFFYRVYKGAKGPLSLLIGVFVPIADFLAHSETLAKALGVALVGMAAAAIAASIAFGLMYAELLIVNAMESAFLSQLLLTNVAIYAQVAAEYVWAYATGVATAGIGGLRAALIPTTLVTWAQTAANWAGVTSFGALTSAIWASVVALYEFWLTLGPIGWIVLGLIGLFAAWKLGLFEWLGVAEEIGVIVDGLIGMFGFLGGIVGGLVDIVGAFVGVLWDLVKVITRIAALPFVIAIELAAMGFKALDQSAASASTSVEAAGNSMERTAQKSQQMATSVKDSDSALESISSTVWGMIRPLLEFMGIVDSTSGKVNLLVGALWMIPGTAVFMAFLKIVGALDMMNNAVGTAREAFEDLSYWAGFLYGILQVLYGLGADFANWALSGVLDFLSPAINAAAGAIEWMNYQIGRAINYVQGLYQGFMQWVDTIVGPLLNALDWLERKLASINQKIQDAIAGLNNMPIVGWFIEDPTDKAKKKGHESGKAMSESFGKGVSDGKHAAKTWIENFTGWVSGYLPSSNAERGPLSNLTGQGAALPQTFAKGAEQASHVAVEAGETVAGSAAEGLDIRGMIARIRRTLASVGFDKLISPVISPEVQTPRVTPEVQAEVMAPNARPSVDPEVRTPRVSPVVEPRVRTPQITPTVNPNVSTPTVTPTVDPTVNGPDSTFPEVSATNVTTPDVTVTTPSTTMEVPPTRNPAESRVTTTVEPVVYPDETPREKRKEKPTVNVEQNYNVEVDSREDPEELEDRMKKISDRGNEDLIRRLETQFFRFETGQ